MSPADSYRIAYYITGHGFGHAARSRAIIDLLAARGVTVYVRTGADPKFFADVPGVRLHREQFDVGSIQRDGLNVDVRATLEAYADLLPRQEEVVAREAALLREEGVRLVVSDIVPVAFEIAAAAGLPSIAASHFTWDWIYEPYIQAYPQYAYLRQAIRENYGKASLALQMPFAHEFDQFRVVEPIPLVVRALTQSRQEVRMAFEVPAGDRLAVLSMGGMDWGGTPLEALAAKAGWVFVLPPDMAALAADTPNFRTVPATYQGFHNLTAAADLMIAKAGGVTVSECIAYRTPLLCTFRNDFREDELLRPALARYAHARTFDKDEFEQGAWIALIDSFVAEEARWEPIDTGGAAVATEKIMSWLGI